MSEKQPRSESIQETARNFLDSKFLSKVSAIDFKIRNAHVQENKGITPDFVRNSYHSYLNQSLKAYQDSGKSLERDATNLAILKVMDGKLPEREITLFDELAIFKNSLIAEISSKVQNIESRTAAHGKFDDLEYIRSLFHEEIQTLNE